MLELPYIGRFDYLARPSIHAPTRVPNDADVEAALRELKASTRELEDKSQSSVDAYEARH